ncbi:MAG: CRISPR-associated protein Cas4 [Firmicutes bacterium]|nr:CRISPR-associated protein Cas4 [Bacillota bacterium]
MYTEEDLLPLSGIQHFAFCRRQWALIHIEQQWQENLLTFDGREMHARADDPFFTETRGTVVVARALPLVSYRLGLYGVADVVEFYREEEGVALPGRQGRWRPHPVEYKRGRPKPDERDTVHLCAQGMCLEEMFGIPVNEGDLFYGRIRRRQRVEFDRALRERVMELATEMHELFARGITPPAEYTPACKNCSLLEICLPKAGGRKSVRRYLAEALHDEV